MEIPHSRTSSAYGCTHAPYRAHFDTAMYEVEFEDGAVERHQANIIAEHICAQIDGEGYTKALLEEIIDHKADHSCVSGDCIIRETQDNYKGLDPVGEVEGSD